MEMARKFNSYKWWYITRIMVLFVIVMIVITGSSFLKEKRRDYNMATVNGVQIHVNEFLKAIQANKVQVTDYFHNKYNAQQSASFWSTSYEGEIPLEVIKKKALEDCVSIKIQQMIAKEQGVMSDISYKGFMKNLKTENHRRQRAIKNNEVIFGPVQYTEDAYFEYVMSNGVLEVKNKLMENDWKPDEQQLKQFYETKKSILYQATPSVKVQQITLSFLDEGWNVDEQLKTEAKGKMESALTKILSGISLEQAVKEMDKNVQVTEQVYSFSNYIHVARSPVTQAVQNLGQGEVIGVIEENGCFYIIKCVENVKAGSGELSFDEVKDRVIKDYIDDKYEEYVHKRILEAEIILNEEEYRKFEM
jgi:hypothetical protein